MGRSRNSALASRSIRNRPRCPPAREAGGSGGRRRRGDSHRPGAGNGSRAPAHAPAAVRARDQGFAGRSAGRLAGGIVPADRPPRSRAGHHPGRRARPRGHPSSPAGARLVLHAEPARRDGNRGHLSVHRLRLVRQGGRDAPRPADRNPGVGQPRQRLSGDRSRGLPRRRLRAEDPRASSRFRGRAGDRGGRLLRRDPTALQAGGHRPMPVRDRARFAHRPADLVGVPPE